MSETEENSLLEVKISSLDQLVLKPEAILIDESIDPDDDEDGMIWTIAKIGNNVSEYYVGDIVYQLSSEQSPAYFRALETAFILTDKYNLKLAVRGNK